MFPVTAAPEWVCGGRAPRGGSVIRVVMSMKPGVLEGVAWERGSRDSRGRLGERGLVGTGEGGEGWMGSGEGKGKDFTHRRSRLRLSCTRWVEGGVTLLWLWAVWESVKNLCGRECPLSRHRIWR